jgi:putative redox protein
MGLYAQRHNLNLAGATAFVGKEMTSTGVRRIARLLITVKLPKTITSEHRQALENAARSCPVSKSLHPEIEQVLKFEYE